MEWVNYHHLLYFWVVAREGGLVPAGKVLRLSHPTLSAQIHTLEAQLGEQLFTKQGRKLALTPRWVGSYTATPTRSSRSAARCSTRSRVAPRRRACAWTWASRTWCPS